MGEAGGAARAVDGPPYFLVVYIEAHGGTPIGGIEGVQTRRQSPQYQDITVTELSIPGDQYCSGTMAPMYDPPPGKPHWDGKSNTNVTPGILRQVFKDQCDNPDNIPAAFEEATRQIKRTYEAAKIKFPEGGFTVRTNSPDYQFFQLHRNPKENDRSSGSGQPRRTAADFHMPMPTDGYGIFCVCTNHPVLKKFCLTAIPDDVVARETYYGEITLDFIDSKIFPTINMIGHDNSNPPRRLGANNWMNAISQTEGTDEDLKKLALKIVDTAFRDKVIHSQDFVTVLRALNIGHAWSFNPACRNLCSTIEPRRFDDPLPEPDNSFPNSQFTQDSQPQDSQPQDSQPQDSQPQARSRSRSGSPSPSQSQSQSQPSRLSKFLNFFRRSYTPSSTSTSGQGGSRKPRRRTTSTTRRKITRKTKKTAYKRKSQKQNRRK